METLDLLGFLENNSILEVYLPKTEYDKVINEYFRGSPQEKGILIESLLGLALKRLFHGRFKWELDIFSEIDFYLDGNCIDAKTTKNSFYPLSYSKTLKS